MPYIALIETVRTTMQELSSLERAGVTCLPRLRKSLHQDERLQRLAQLLEDGQHVAAPVHDMRGDIRCSFCAKSALEVRVVVRAPLAAIYDECIAIKAIRAVICNACVESASATGGAKRPSTPET
jgi:hypothetical protein